MLAGELIFAVFINLNTALMQIYSRYSASKSVDTRELLDAARAGKLRIWTEKIAQNLTAVVGATRLLNDNVSNKFIRSVIDSIRSDIAEADHRVRAYLLG